MLGIPSYTTSIPSYTTSIPSLAFVGVPLLLEDISPDSRVLLLRGEASLIDRYLLWVDKSCTGGAAYIGELIATQQFVGTWFGATHTIYGGEVAFGGFAVNEAYFVVFTDASVDLVHRERVFYFCHIVGIGLPQDRRKIVVGCPPSLLLNQNRLAILI